MLHTIFLDLDDTLLDFTRAEAGALSRALRQLDIVPTPAILERYHVLNAAQWRLLEEGKLTRSQVLSRRFELLFAELGLERASHEICGVYEEFLSQSSFLLPGAQALLEELSARYDLYLATNGTAAVQHRRLEGAGIGKYFKGIFISQEIGCDKPSPAYFRACFAAIPDFDPAAALMVGDSLTSDIRGGRSAGIRTCWFNPGGAAPSPEIVPDFEIAALSALPPLLERL